VTSRPTAADLEAARDRTIPDVVPPPDGVLFCGINPGLYSAATGWHFARPGNRFWPAALAAGVVTRTHDPMHALRVDGLGMTDLVKRATPSADELTVDDYRDGFARVERLARWLQPGAVCFVGLAGWRAAVDDPRRRRGGPRLHDDHVDDRTAKIWRLTCVSTSCCAPSRPHRSSVIPQSWT
jgi:TDG/mug DNA glycosylase family protein